MLFVIYFVLSLICSFVAGGFYFAHIKVQVDGATEDLILSLTFVAICSGLTVYLYFRERLLARVSSKKLKLSD